MASDYRAIDISNNPELRRLADEVRKTKRSQTLHLADGVVAVIKPEWQTAPRKRRAHQRTNLSSLTLDEVFGSVTTPPHLHGADIDEMIREAKDDHAARVMREC